TADKEQIQRRIEVLKKQIAAEKAVPVAPPVATPVANNPAPTPPPETPPEQGKRSFVPLIVAGAGGVVLIAGAAVYGKASKDVKHYEDVCPNRDCGSGSEAAANKEAANNARTRKIWGGVVTGIGAATVAGGLIWYFVQPRQPAGSASLRRPLVSPTAAPGFAGIAVSGAF
ncbi:MAG TPA: hypothetical protein VFJ90_06960, partial [Candidatus Didemnitutus sp.]|nr:hypothetical protein [Candidatus Didemnitutus sp.]